MKEVAGKLHLGWAQWVVRGKRQSGCEHATFKARALRTTADKHISHIIIKLKQ